MYRPMYAIGVARLIRKQVYIEPRQERLLKRRAKELGVSEADLIREGIDLLGRSGRPTAHQRRLEALAESERYIRKHRRQRVPQTGRGWTREDLYEERLTRYGPAGH